MLPLRVHRKAVAELRKAQRDYARVDPQLARDFTDSYLERVRFIVRFPEGGHRIPKHTTALVQRYAMRRFPYKIITATKGDQQAILVVAHNSRAPDYWEARISDV